MCQVVNLGKKSLVHIERFPLEPPATAIGQKRGVGFIVGRKMGMTSGSAAPGRGGDRTMVGSGMSSDRGSM